MDLRTLLLAGAGVLVAAAMAARAFSAPLRLAGRAAVNTLLGLGALLLLNVLSPLTGLSLGLNLFNALVVGILGVPGLGLLLLVQWVLT
ncbi:MAG: Pro-sigmaK processing inhibitor BofA [Oscillospiraceae bacterium]|jgi:inhibitor of the pro-sigma K processing machinery|nr:Pro-sigmaK processing inhibitor BofA [Oscillospiraceae bacterium]